ncbi:uncharacterized protein ACLA_077860 [Aspergillus clavatus NRRL 1]|uniref:Uncharacterized protein n=1 Tax=Aspergillus clavatus (strain ATCC 1007 / CBS 513.65 / DSM 816 / NCTC 3887 / NRRL 1 / QM 1276 / 107) TaxID=344612 RepID=A1CLR0_ASPCL|nr:uncharacterized protein ACLA_077860 [Aspergillus clavatus NRRL 1]EAW09039.1 hypothetical protein ACLA_077860 [Aspergillus clavatus NRRL 1]
MRRSIVLLVAALSACVFASPAASAGSIIDPHVNARSVDAEVSVLDDPGYIAAWESVTGSTPANAPNATEHNKRNVGPIQGYNNYVSVYFRNGRYFITLVLVSNIRGAFKDLFVTTPEIASAIATNARDIMAKATGLGSYEDAIRAACTLADSYGMTSPIFWAYPQNNKRDKSASDIRDFTILANFTPTVTLADYLFNTFHNVNHTAMTRGADQEGHLSKRAKFCLYYNEKDRLLKGWVPWNTQSDVGCIGQLSDFD